MQNRNTNYGAKSVREIAGTKSNRSSESHKLNRCEEPRNELDRGGRGGALTLPMQPLMEMLFKRWPSLMSPGAVAHRRCYRPLDSLSRARACCLLGCRIWELRDEEKPLVFLVFGGRWPAIPAREVMVLGIWGGTVVWGFREAALKFPWGK